MGTIRYKYPRMCTNRVFQPDFECNNEPKELVFYLKGDQTVIDILGEVKSIFQV